VAVSGALSATNEVIMMHTLYGALDRSADETFNSQSSVDWMGELYSTRVARWPGLNVIFGRLWTVNIRRK
jgi:hypothetical protein